MSQRGSFTTEYIGCQHCLEVAKKVLINDDKYHFGIQLPSWETGDKHLPIISGKLGGTWYKQELFIMEELIGELEKHICHPLTIAVLPEGGENEFLTAKPPVSPIPVVLQPSPKVAFTSTDNKS